MLSTARTVTKRIFTFTASWYNRRMVDELVHLLGIRKDLLAKAEVLAAVAESEAESRVALECLRLAAQCKKLDGAIEAFTNRVLESQAPQGTG